MTAELSGSQNLPTSWATSPMLGWEQDWGGRMCAAKRGRHLNMSLPLEGKQGFQEVWASTSFKKTSSFLNWEEKLFLPGAMCSQIDYISESPGTLGETQIPKYQPGLTESEFPFFPYSSPEEAGRTGILIVRLSIQVLLVLQVLRCWALPVRCILQNAVQWCLPQTHPGGPSFTSTRFIC